MKFLIIHVKSSQAELYLGSAWLGLARLKKLASWLGSCGALIPGEEDIETFLKRLYDKKDEDPRWVITMKLDSATGSLTHLFWMTPEQQILWLRYHDVIMHDNTCKTNRYNRPLSLFVTPDNNLKTRIVAQAIVDDESQFSYEWVFQCVKEATGVAPKVFVTDGDPAVNAAVAIQFPNTFHMHCI